ncbi:hypothetical protein DKX38_022674 [Salix brachista]|uniref:Uncharacterized protein n=1 Tax=Salix brachista TaxID=2182728 RepID=A0A5N5K5V3_9ROSI|nr:hypothetical protein DKX38_022674 [Salix brachista]
MSCSELERMMEAVVPNLECDISSMRDKQITDTCMGVGNALLTSTEVLQNPGMMITNGGFLTNFVHDYTDENFVGFMTWIWKRIFLSSMVYALKKVINELESGSFGAALKLCNPSSFPQNQNETGNSAFLPTSVTSLREILAFAHVVVVSSDNFAGSSGLKKKILISSAKPKGRRWTMAAWLRRIWDCVLYLSLRRNKLGKKLARKAILGKEVKLGFQIVFYSAQENFWSLFNQIGNVGFAKVMGFQELEDGLRVLEVVFTDLELLGN